MLEEVEVADAEGERVSQKSEDEDLLVVIRSQSPPMLNIAVNVKNAHWFTVVTVDFQKHCPAFIFLGEKPFYPMRGSFQLLFIEDPSEHHVRELIKVFADSGPSSLCNMQKHHQSSFFMEVWECS